MTMVFKRPAVIVALLLLMVLLFSFTGKVRHILIHGQPGLDDHERFPVRVLTPDSARHFGFVRSVSMFGDIDFEKVIAGYNQLEDEIERSLSGTYNSFADLIESIKTVAFLIIRNDTIVYEQYFDGYDRASEISSFSMAKSFLSVLTGCAIDDGYIASVDDPVSHYVPELKENGFDRVTIRHLLQMTSGINFSEVYYNPFKGPVDLYHSEDLFASLQGISLRKEPGMHHNYNSGDSQILGFVLHRALGGKSISSYMQERLWEPLGMEHTGSWVIDKVESGMEKTFCCLSGSPEDFAKFGRLYLHRGHWNGQRIVSEDWVVESLKTDSLHGSDPYYQYHWHVTENSFSAYGYAGQVVYVEPARGLIMVRMGTDRSRLNWGKFFSVIAEVLPS